MKERISRLANGLVEYEEPKPQVNPETIEDAIDSGLTAKGEFYIASENSIPLKGLIYSTNNRVFVLKPSFGGIKNRIEYEVRGQHLKHNDTIEGYFHLITNGGEMEIPYCFHVSLGASGKALGNLGTSQDFADLAEENMDIALRLFEYSDFIKSPFLQDLTIRAIYDSIRGKGNRELALEEFLIGIAAKDSIELIVEKRQWLFPQSEEVINALIEIHKNTWGYIKIQVTADAEFIELEKDLILSGDFHGNIYDLPFQINNQKLHCGRNYGKIRIKTTTQDIEILITALGASRENHAALIQKEYKYSFNQYMEHRLDYESGSYQEALLLVKMYAELEHMFNLRKSDVAALLIAENLIIRGKTDQACLILDEYREHILSIRQEELELYCFYQYLQTQIPTREGQTDSLVRLLHKFDEEEPTRFYLFLLLLKMDEKFSENGSHLLIRMKEQYQSGCNSPFLYLHACSCLNKEPRLLRALNPFEIHSLAFGCKRDLIGEELALQIAALSALEKNCQKIYLKILEGLYEKYPRKEILEAICGILIKGNCKSNIYFPWFAMGVKEEIRLTKFFEYYLYTCPRDFSEVFPTEVLLYFSYPHTLNEESKELLYHNILSYLDKTLPIFNLYERQLEDFAISCLFAGRINDKMAVIYHHIIYKDLIDEKIAKVLPELLRSYRVECDAPFIQSVVVCYEELKKKIIVPLHDGIAYVPMYVDDCMLLFQDAYGNRYIEVNYKRSRLMYEPELEERCFEVYPNHLMIQLRTCKEIIKLESLDPNQVQVVEQVLNEKILHELYVEKLISMLITYYSQSEGIRDHDLLAYLDKSKLSPSDRILAVEALIQQGQIRAAYDIIAVYGYEGMKSSRLMKLCTKMILEQLFDHDDLLLVLSYQVFKEGIFDKVILDYLCEYYNGTVKEMYEILTQGVEAQVETYSMEERLLGQILFTNNLEYLDRVFHLYIDRKAVKESLVKAYFTVKCYNYFILDEVRDPEVFEYLEADMAKNMNYEKTALIWELALTKYFASLSELTQTQINLCEAIIPKLLDRGYVFKYMQQLKSFIKLPNEVLDKTIIEYKGSKDDNIKIRMRILPGETNYHLEGMRYVYEGIYIKQVILFDNESLEYEIYEEMSEVEEILDRGLITNSGELHIGEDSLSLASGNRFSLLNEITLCMDLGDESILREKMSEYVVMDEIVAKLFGPGK